MKCIIDRRAQFSASHRYWLPELSEAENIEQFGACTRSPGHGHNYVLYVSMAGDLDEYGMVLNLSDVKQVIKREVTSQLDFSYLNDAWPEFQQTLPTTERSPVPSGNDSPPTCRSSAFNFLNTPNSGQTTTETTWKPISPSALTLVPPIVLLAPT